MPADNRSCYHAGSNKTQLWLGIGLVVLGLLIIFLCVPLWAWPLIISLALIALGLVLLRK